MRVRKKKKGKKRNKLQRIANKNRILDLKPVGKRMKDFYDAMGGKDGKWFDGKFLLEFKIESYDKTITEYETGKLMQETCITALESLNRFCDVFTPLLNYERNINCKRSENEDSDFSDSG